MTSINPNLNVPIKVVCAIIILNNKILTVQRSDIMKLPNKWEFPGGKLEPFESEYDCLHREVKEELDITIDIVQRLKPVIHEYPNLTIELIPYLARFANGELTLNEHAQSLWLAKHDLLSVDWAEADLPIVHDFIKNEYEI